MAYFTQEELKCKCGRQECDAPPATPALMSTLEKIRGKVGRAIRANSGSRCVYWNARQGGKADSDHLTGEGADLAAEDSRSRYELVSAALAAGVTRLGIHKSFIHVGVSQRLDPRVIWLY